MNTKLPSVTITGLQLSDLFFNAEKPNYDAVFRENADMGSEERPPQEQINAALLKDAREFAGNIVGAPDGGIAIEDLAQLLVEDFNARV